MADFGSHKGEKFCICKNRIISSHLILKKASAFAPGKDNTVHDWKQKGELWYLVKPRSFNCSENLHMIKSCSPKPQKLSLSTLAKMQHSVKILKSWDKIQKLILFCSLLVRFPQDLSLSHKHTWAVSTRWCDPPQGCICHLSDTWTTLIPKATFRLCEIGTKQEKTLACGPALFS